ncbi:non-specific lipid-transfer protein A-like protein [Corchorus olitorius]|uniref:Non-specific lipid-transfer protein A-like protein n=1 Tax=Corchorus olitorius TaxID=93759 RepID=A0A1R3JWH4_9ROSI|nr:non-specific lipid-transfer protein A-like protein [Corchorus olitorius]
MLVVTPMAAADSCKYYFDAADLHIQDAVSCEIYLYGTGDVDFQSSGCCNFVYEYTWPAPTTNRTLCCVDIIQGYTNLPALNTDLILNLPQACGTCK